MLVSVAYHVGGKFEGTGKKCRYIGGETLTFREIDSDMISVQDLEFGLKTLLARVDLGKVMLYYKKSITNRVDSYEFIHNDDHIRDLCATYKGRDVYDIYVDEVVDDNPGCKENANESDENDLDFEENEIDKESEFDDSEFELGSWISEEDREEFEEIRKKVCAAKENIKSGNGVLASHNGDAFESDGFDSDENGYYEEIDTDGECSRRKSPFVRYNKNTDKPYFETFMTFSSMKEIRDAIRKHAIKEKKDLTWVKNDPDRVRLTCKWKSCGWIFYASLNNQFNEWQLKRYVPRVCADHYENSFITPTFLAKHYKRTIKSNRKWKIKDMQHAVKEEFGCDVTAGQCSKAKAKVLRTLFAVYKEEYALLRTYAEELLRVNPGSTVKIMVDTNNPKEEPRFQRMYVCFDALKKGCLAGCRRYISLDGCFLKGLCKGELLTAIGRDANDQMYPIAWSVVEVESRSSWEWFLEHLSSDLNIGNGIGWCFSSDQQKGLVPSISALFPDAEHRLCARHIYSNWRKKYRNPNWQSIFWKCAKSTTEAFFNRNKEEMTKENAEAAEAMTNIDPKHWCRAYFTTYIKCDSVDNNMSESFNSLIVEARHKPIFTMLEDIRIMCMEQIAVKRTLARKWKGDYCPKILRKLAGNAKKVRYCQIVANGKNGYEVRQKTEDSEDHFSVLLDDMKCSCRSWDLTGISCAHVITCVLSEGKEPESYISEWYKVDNYWGTYDNVMLPMDGHKSWVPSKYPLVLPSLRRKMPGRPKKNRIRSVEEKEDGARRRRRVYTDEELMARDKNDPMKMTRVGRVMTCKICKKGEHNSRTCALRNKN